MVASAIATASLASVSYGSNAETPGRLGVAGREYQAESWDQATLAKARAAGFPHGWTVEEHCWCGVVSADPVAGLERHEAQLVAAAAGRRAGLILLAAPEASRDREWVAVLGRGVEALAGRLGDVVNRIEVYDAASGELLCSWAREAAALTTAARGAIARQAHEAIAVATGRTDPAKARLALRYCGAVWARDLPVTRRDPMSAAGRL